MPAVRILGRHLAAGFLLRALATAGVAATLGTLIGVVEGANRPEGNEGATAWWLGALARAPETVFFACPVVVLLAALWTAHDLVPPPVREGLGGAGVAERAIDRPIALAVLPVLLAVLGLGGWIAPAAQRAAAVDAEAAWARSGGAPEWAARGWTWIRSGETLVRVEIDGGAVRAARVVRLDRDGPLAFEPPEAAGALRLPTAAEVRLLATPPAWLTAPELARAAEARRSWGHVTGPVDAELALRLAVLLLLAPATAAALACRRIRSGARRWSLAAALVFLSLLGLQASNVWAARGELPVAAVVAVPLAAATVVAVVAWWLGRGESPRRAAGG
jgi:lipopolysaccharide export LptBFGC system permease protein LptF